MNRWLARFRELTDLAAPESRTAKNEDRGRPPDGAISSHIGGFKCPKCRKRRCLAAA